MQNLDEIQHTPVVNGAYQELQAFFTSGNPMRSVLIMVFSIIIAYWVSKYLAKVIIYFAQYIATRSDSESDELRAQKLREIETYLSVTVAMVRAFIVAITAYVLWSLLSDTSGSNSSIAAIGASAFFIVFAGQSLGMLIRDVTAGAVMIAEKWFTIGDFIKVEPFIDVTGVVERMTLRSTRIRSLSGEVIWINNQQMQAVHVSPRGVRTMAVDVFVRDRVRGERALEDIINTIPTGPTMLASPLRITHAERWNDELWRITVVGQTLPGREWLIEGHFVNMVETIDKDVEKQYDKLIVHTPIARFADADAERKFKRAVRVHKKQASSARKKAKK
jgi:small conductance mechanosensitive channel